MHSYGAIFWGNSLQLASVLSKLAASQEMLGKSTNSKLTWERALFIWEINRTKRRSANGRAKKQERDASIIGTHSKEPKYRNYCSHTHSAVRQFSLEEIFVCPHHTMQYVDGCILYGHRISMENLTPRTRKVLRDRNGIQIYYEYETFIAFSHTRHYQLKTVRNSS